MAYSFVDSKNIVDEKQKGGNSKQSGGERANFGPWKDDHKVGRARKEIRREEKMRKSRGKTQMPKRIKISTYR